MKVFRRLIHSHNSIKPLLRSISDAAVVTTGCNKQFASVPEFKRIGIMEIGFLLNLQEELILGIIIFVCFVKCRHTHFPNHQNRVITIVS